MKKTWSVHTQANGQATLFFQKEQPFLYHIALYAILAAISLILPRATVYGGLSPFGVSLAACAKGGSVFVVYIAAAIGYFLSGDTLMPLRYIAALVAVAGFRWAVSGASKITDNPFFSPSLAFGSTLITGVAINSFQGLQIDVLLAELCEAVLAGGAAYFFDQSIRLLQNERGRGALNIAQQSSLVISASVLLMAFHSITIYDISVGRIVTMTVILVAAKAGQQHGGMLSGVVFGAATAIGSPAYAHLSVAYAFGGLMTGLFSRFGRAVMALLFILINALTVLTTGERETIVIGMYEVMASSLLFLILPRSVERAANVLFCRTQHSAAADGLQRTMEMRLTYAAQTMNEIASTVDAVSEKLMSMDAPKLKDVYVSVCTQLCEGCSRRDVCWQEHFTDTMANFRAMGKTLIEAGVLSDNDIPAEFRGSCRHVHNVQNVMNKGYSRFVLRENAFRRLSDIRSIVTDQFEGMSSLLLDLSDELHRMDRTDEQATSRVRHICERYRMPLVEAACLIGRRNRLRVELLIEGDAVPDESSRWYREICDACGCNLEPPKVLKNGYITKISLTQKPRFAVEFAFAQLNCEKEKLCGDAFERFYDQDGRYCVVLSDGMGTGGRAAVDGAMTAALCGRMMQAGFRYDSILRIINSALIVKSGDESLSTLDAVKIDLYNGQINGMKAGAAPSFLYADGGVSKITASSLPIGILKNIEAECYDDHIGKDQLFVMVSDGVVEDEDSEWLEELICRLMSQQAKPKMIADEIVFYARERRKNEHCDDTTALVVALS